MRKLILLLLFLNFSIVNSQVVEYAENEFVHCDTASSNLELAMCSLYYLEKAEKELDSIYKEVLIYLEKMAREYEILKLQLNQEGPPKAEANFPDVRKIKNSVIESQNLFIQYANLEAKITGELIGEGKERTYRENMRKVELISLRIQDLKSIID